MNHVENDIRDLFAKYLKAWNRRDFSIVAACYTEPGFFVLPNMSLTLEDASATISLLKKIFAGLDEEDFSHTEIDEISVNPHSEQLATADAYGVRRLRHDGSEIEVINAHYVLRRTDVGWQFTTAVSLPYIKPV